MTVVYCGRYQRSKNIFEYCVLVRHVLDVADEAHRRVLVGVRLEEPVALHLERASRSGSALFLLYSPRIARASVLKSASEYDRCWNMSA